MSAPPEAAKPVWCNLSFTTRAGREELRSVLMHGLPRDGDYVDTEWGMGVVHGVTFVPVIDDSYKAIVFVKEYA